MSRHWPRPLNTEQAGNQAGNDDAEPDQVYEPTYHGFAGLMILHFIRPCNTAAIERGA